MRSDGAGLLLLVLLAADVAVAVQAPTTLSRPGQVPAGGVTGPRDRPKPATGTALIRGVVVGGEGGAPLRRAFVRVSGAELREGRVASTDEQGRWEVKNLPAGRYSLSAMKAGYVSLEYGQRRPFESGRPIEVADGQQLANLNFNLPRGSAITGRVTDEFGDPLSEVMVAAMRYRFVGGRRRMVPVGRFVHSDDGGNFRVFGLAPGDYYLSATLRDFGMNDAETQSGYAPTYYPGTSSPQQAEKITLGVAAEASGILLSLMPVRTAKVSGTAMDSQGRPMAGAFVSLVEGSPGCRLHDVRRWQPGARRWDVYAPERVAGRIHADGQRDGSAGHNRAGVDAADGDRRRHHRDRARRDEGDPDQGTNRVRRAAAGRHRPPASFSVNSTPKDPADMPTFFGFGGLDRVNDDWTFELRAGGNSALIRTERMPAGYSLKGVFWRGEDVTDSGIALKGSEAITGVEVVVTARTSNVAGAVNGADGKPTADYVVVIFAEDSEQWGFQSRQIAIARPDQQGGFVVKGLPAGKLPCGRGAAMSRKARSAIPRRWSGCEASPRHSLSPTASAKT